MQGDDKLSARSSIQRLRLPRPFAWAALAFLSLALALVVFVVRAQPRVGTQVLSTESGLVREFLDEQKNLLLVLSTILTVLGLWALRRLRFAQLVRKPGPVEILQFLKGQDTEAPVENIVAHFRKALRDVSLAPPMSMPGEPVPQDFLHVLRTATSQATGTIGAVVGMLSTLQVNSAYRVSGVLRQRDKNPGCGLTVHIVTLPKSTGAVQTFWADDWFDVAELGAHFVGAYVLPRSRICARPPWTAWQGLPIPHQLIHHYQVAQSMLREERYEEALDALHSALHKDPQNPYLRIQVAQLREQLGQHLDAVTDYGDIIAIQAWQDRRLWKRLSRWRSEPPGRPFIRLGSHRNGREALLVARYRLVSALVRGSQLASQWHESDLTNNRRRREERGMLRDRMRKWLTPRYKEFRRFCVGLPEDFREFVDERPNLLPLLFQFVAVRETIDLIKDYSWVQGRRRPYLPIPQSALRVLGVWTALHLILAELRVPEEADAAGARCADKDMVPIREKLGLTGGNSSWPPDSEVIELLLDGALRWKPRALQGWQEHYNSASTFAVLLLHENVDAESSELIATKAVRCLERAVLTTGSGLSSRYGKWLAFGDQDLNGLRGTGAFADFNDRYFPRSDLRKTRWPREMLEQVLTAHIAGLVRQYAALRADFWESRAQHTADLLVAEEAQRERDAALIVGDYIQDHWSWQVRLRLIKEAQRFAERRGDASSFNSCFPSVDTILSVAAEGVDGSGRQTPHALTSRSGDPTGHDEHRRGKDITLLGSLWRAIDAVLADALRGDPTAMRKAETSLCQIVSVAERAEHQEFSSSPSPAG